MNKTNINWCDFSWNPITGCTKIAQGCKFCYAERIANRFWKDRKFADVQFHPERLNDKKLNSKKPMRIFVNSMSDLFHESLSFEIIEQVYDVIFNQLINYPQHVFMILTKRTKRAKEFYEWMHKKHRSTDWGNVWFGFSASTQKDLDAGIDNLLEIDAMIKWLSIEPMLEEINSNPIVNWIVIGCEGGHNRRFFNNEWAVGLAGIYRAMNIPVWIKQIRDEKNNVIEDVNLFPERLRIRQLPTIKGL